MPGGVGVGVGGMTPAFKVGSNKSHLNVSLTEGQRRCP